jgi:drug/metabolite transporter (DMT)-like permease
MLATITSQQKPLTPSLIIKLMMVALLWGGTFVSGRYLSQYMPTLLAACLRFLIATTSIGTYLIITEGRIPRLSSKELAATGLLALCGMVGYNLFFFGALSHMPASRTALLVALNPVITALMMRFLFKEKLAPHRWLGIVIALTGTYVVITHGQLASIFSNGLGVGELMMACAAGLWAIYTVFYKKLIKEGSAVVVTFYACLFATGMLFLGSLWQQHIHPQATEWSGTVIGTLIYFGMFATALGFVWYYQGVDQVGAARTAIFNNFVPVFGVLLGVLILHESIDISMLLGGGLVLAGVVLMNRL